MKLFAKIKEYFRNIKKKRVMKRMKNAINELSRIETAMARVGISRSERRRFWFSFAKSKDHTDILTHIIDRS